VKIWLKIALNDVRLPKFEPVIVVAEKDHGKLAAFRRGRSFGAKISGGGSGRPWGMFCYPTAQTAPCYVLSF